MGKWTTDPGQAHDFKFIARAVNFVRKTKSANFEVDLRFDSRLHAACFRFEELFAAS